MFLDTIKPYYGSFYEQPRRIKLMDDKKYRMKALLSRRLRNKLYPRRRSMRVHIRTCNLCANIETQKALELVNQLLNQTNQLGIPTGELNSTYE